MRKCNKKFQLKRGGGKKVAPSYIHAMTNDKQYLSAALIMALGQMQAKRGVV